MMIKLFPWDHFLSDSTLQTKQWSSHKASGNMLPTGLLKPGLGSLAEDVPKPNWQSMKGLPSCSSYMTTKDTCSAHTLYTFAYLTLTTTQRTLNELSVLDMSIRGLRVAYRASLRTRTPQIYCAETSLCFSPPPQSSVSWNQIDHEHWGTASISITIFSRKFGKGIL